MVRSMVDTRRATPEDAAELVRLRGLMLAALAGVEPVPGPWQEMTRDSLRDWLAEPEPWLAAAASAGMAARARGPVRRPVP